MIEKARNLEFSDETLQDQENNQTTVILHASQVSISGTGGNSQSFIKNIGTSKVLEEE